MRLEFVHDNKIRFILIHLMRTLYDLRFSDINDILGQINPFWKVRPGDQSTFYSLHIKRLTREDTEENGISLNINI